MNATENATTPAHVAALNLAMHERLALAMLNHSPDKAKRETARRNLDRIAAVRKAAA